MLYMIIDISGTASASKALIVDASKDIDLGTGDLSVTNITANGTVGIGTSPQSTKLLTISKTSGTIVNGISASLTSYYNGNSWGTICYNYAYGPVAAKAGGIISRGGQFGVEISDGPTHVFSWSDPVNETYIAEGGFFLVLDKSGVTYDCTGSGKYVLRAGNFYVPSALGNWTTNNPPITTHGIYISAAPTGYGSNHTHYAAYSAGGPIYHVGPYSDDIAAKTIRDLYIASDGQVGYTSSSVKYKKNIRDLDDSDRIQNLRPRKYDREKGNVKDEVGLIAEEVEAIYPEAISYKRNVFYKDVDIVDDNGNVTIDRVVDRIEITDEPETVNYSRLIVPMLKEIQKLRAEVDELNRR